MENIPESSEEQRSKKYSQQSTAETVWSGFCLRDTAAYDCHPFVLFLPHLLASECRMKTFNG